jgi:hypothetical protein
MKLATAVAAYGYYSTGDLRQACLYFVWGFVAWCVMGVIVALAERE